MNIEKDIEKDYELFKSWDLASIPLICGWLFENIKYEDCCKNCCMEYYIKPYKNNDVDNN